MDCKGMIQFNRVYGGNNILFGSAVQHDVVMKLTIYTAKTERNFSIDRYYPIEKLIEIEMSPAQYAELITNLNHGLGVPCTLKKFNGKIIPNNLRIKDEMETFKKEYKQEINDLFDNIKERIDNIDENKPLSIKKIKELKGSLNNLIYSLEREGPFIAGIFNEYIEKTFVEAQAKIENEISIKLTELGIEKINEITIQKTKQISEKNL